MSADVPPAITSAVDESPSLFHRAKVEVLAELPCATDWRDMSLKQGAASCQVTGQFCDRSHWSVFTTTFSRAADGRWYHGSTHIRGID